MKKFFWKDKSGRGFTSNSITDADLKKWEDLESWDGTPLHEFAEGAEEGDIWEDNSDQIICTGEEASKTGEEASA